MKWQFVQIVHTPYAGDPFTSVGMHFLVDFYLDQMSGAQNEWSNVISHWDDLSEADPGYPDIAISKTILKKCVRRWLNEDGDDEKSGSIIFDFPNKHEFNPEYYSRRYFNREFFWLKQADIARCFNCRMPIALMKKCAGCRKIKFVLLDQVRIHL